MLCVGAKNPSRSKYTTITVPPNFKDDVQRVLDRTGVGSQAALIGRLMAWFLRQTDEVQGIVLGQIPESLSRISVERAPPEQEGHRASHERRAG
jgi:hypothetical protein